MVSPCNSECSSQSSVITEAGDLFATEPTPAWFPDNEEQHSQDPAADFLLYFRYSAITEDSNRGLASSTMLVYTGCQPLKVTNISSLTGSPPS